MSLIDRVHFKRLIIIICAVKNNMSLQRINCLEELFDTYYNYILIPGKSKQEIDNALSTLEKNEFIKRYLKSWYWDYRIELHDITDAEKFVYLSREMKSLLDRTRNKELISSYKNRMNNDFVNLISNSDLLD